MKTNGGVTNTFNNWPTNTPSDPWHLCVKSWHWQYLTMFLEPRVTLVHQAARSLVARLATSCNQKDARNCALYHSHLLWCSLLWCGLWNLQQGNDAKRQPYLKTSSSKRTLVLFLCLFLYLFLFIKPFYRWDPWTFNTSCLASTRAHPRQMANHFFQPKPPSSHGQNKEGASNSTSRILQ